MQFVMTSNSISDLLQSSLATPPADSDRLTVGASGLPNQTTPSGLSSKALQLAPLQDAQLLPGSNATGIIPSPNQQPVPHAPPLDNVNNGLASDISFDAAPPEAGAGSQGLNTHSTDIGAGSRSEGTNTTGVEAGSRNKDSNSTDTDAGSRRADTNHTRPQADNNPARKADPQTHVSSPSDNIPDPMNSPDQSVPYHSTSPGSPNPTSPSTSLSPAASTRLPSSDSTMPTLVFAHASSPALPLPANGPKPQPSSEPSTSSAAVRALPPSNVTAPANQAGSAHLESAADDQSNISHAITINTATANSHQNPSQNNKMVPTFSPLEDNTLDPPALAPASAAVKTAPTGLLPAAFLPQTGATDNRAAAPGQSPAALQQMPADSAQTMGPSAAAPLALLGTALAPAPASSRAAAAPGDAQAVHEKAHTDKLPMIVLSALLGVAIAALLGGKTKSFPFFVMCTLIISHCALCCSSVCPVSMGSFTLAAHLVCTSGSTWLHREAVCMLT